MSPTVQQIAQQNDQFRQGDPNVPGQRVITAGIDRLLKQLGIPMGELAQLVAEYSDFNPDNGNPPPSHGLQANHCRAVDGPNQRWSLDFVSDALADGRRFRILAVVDDFSRENLVLVADTSLSGHRVARELDRIVAERGLPKTIVSDNGTEFTSMAILKWVQETGIDWHYIAPGNPQQNGFIHCPADDARIVERGKLQWQVTG